METKQIRHKGEVTRVDGERVTVSYKSQGGCGSCAARSKCGMVESEGREVEVIVGSNDNFCVGDSVTISVTMGMGRMAVVLAYVVPLFLLIILMCIGAVLHLEEWGVALMGLVGVALYYCALYFTKDRIEQKINFTIEK